ncbi:hypothetical protein FFE93_000445 [Yersinia sp. KBS0713]|uniref:hypothetical protein n=1 Tax=Yersinia TaxID=629 RepID=UPI00110EF23A|nr:MULTISPECIES: hypothetical protein [Yersinia]QDW31673.1 hypothetical protein FFE93_000445 [Yersinia sp. KBS0713]
MFIKTDEKLPVSEARRFIYNTLAILVLYMHGIPSAQAQLNPGPDPYGHVNFFVSSAPASGANNNPYDACQEYAGYIRYRIVDNPVMVFTVGENTREYRFRLEDLVAEAATTWNNALRADIPGVSGGLSCEFYIRAASALEPPNYRVQAISFTNNNIVALGVPAGYESAQSRLGITQAGIYVPTGLVIPINRNTIESFEQNTPHEEIARYIARHTIIHEMGHTLGLRHPDTAPRNSDQIAPHQRQIQVPIINNSAQSLPIMISQPGEYFSRSRQRGLINATTMPLPSPAEANAIRRVNICSPNSSQNAKERSLKSDECNYHITYSIFDVTSMLKLLLDH